MSKSFNHEPSLYQVVYVYFKQLKLNKKDTDKLVREWVFSEGLEDFLR